MLHRNQPDANVHKSDVVVLPTFEELVPRPQIIPELQEEDSLSASQIEKTAEDILFDAQQTKKKADDYAKKTIDEAKSKAEQIVLIAKNEGESIRNQAYDEGFAEGKNDATAIGEELALKHTEEFERFIEKLKQYQTSMFDDVKSEILDAVIDISRKILHVEIQKNDEALINLINTAIVNIAQEENKKIMLSNADFERLEKSQSSSYLEMLAEKDIKVIPSSEVNEGECRADYKNGSINVGIETQLDRAKHILTKELI